MLKNKGTTKKVLFDGTEYTSVEDANEKGPKGRGQFLIPTLNPFNIKESICIKETLKDMEYIWLHEVGSKGACFYFGPAKTKKESNEIF